MTVKLDYLLASLLTTACINLLHDQSSPSCNRSRPPVRAHKWHLIKMPSTDNHSSLLLMILLLPMRGAIKFDEEICWIAYDSIITVFWTALSQLCNILVTTGVLAWKNAGDKYRLGQFDKGKTSIQQINHQNVFGNFFSFNSKNKLMNGARKTNSTTDRLRTKMNT